GAGYMLMPSGSMNRNGYMAELSFNLPWLNRSNHDAEIREAQSRVNVQRAELSAQQAMVFQEIQEALIRANTAARLVEIYRDTLRPQAQPTLRVASAAYQPDQTDFLNLSTVRTRHLMSSIPITAHSQTSILVLSISNAR